MPPARTPTVKTDAQFAQLATYQRTNDFKAVVDQIVTETLVGVPLVSVDRLQSTAEENALS